MAYNINKSNSDPVTIPTGAIDNQFDIPLIGQDAINYGDDLALAFVRLLENFAADNEPAFGSARTTGQLYYDTTGTGTLKVYDGTAFVAIPKTSEVVQNTGDESISGDKTFTGRPAFNGGTSGVDSPFDVDSTFVVSNLNADLLDGQEGSYYAPASSVVGKETMWIPATQMYPSATNGADGYQADFVDDNAVSGGDTVTVVFPTPDRIELTAGNPEISVWKFDQTTQESVQFSVAMPKRWDEGTVTFQAFWTTQNADTGNVTFGLQGVAMGTNELIDTAYGTAQEVTSSAQGIEDLNVSTESTAITIGGTPGEDNMTFFRIYRDAATDTHTADALLIGIKLFWTSNAATDA